jgi:hypothetical protein
MAMEQLLQLVGAEKSLTEVSQSLCFDVRSLDCASIGALHVTCADESEYECVEAFQHGFVRYLLPQLKSARHAAFRLANLGGRYEWGSVRLAEDHFATSPSETGSKLMLVKINAHVSFEPLSGRTGTESDPASDPPFRLGVWRRYGRDSACCGMLQALLEGHAELPAAGELREAFRSEGVDRLALLRDERRVEPIYRPLFAAIVSARLQARKVVLDIQDYNPTGPALFLVAPCVTINRHERDTEIICGLYTIDSRSGRQEVSYTGLGDDPSGYEVQIRNRLFVVSDGGVGRQRSGRDHRALVRHEWRARGTRPIEIRDERLERIRRDVAENKHRHHGHARTLLRVALPVLAEVAPIPAAVLMFADGAVGMHHAFRVHRLAREMSGSHEARQILDEIESRVDQLEPDRAEALIEMLMDEYSP